MTLDDIQSNCIISQESKLVDTPCWVWQGRTDKDGYGRLKVGQKGSVGVHRRTYFLATGDSAEGKDVHHWCEVTGCCNPSHLESMGHSEHMKITGIGEHNASKTHCLRGHPFDEKNTVVVQVKDGSIYRKCVACYIHYRSNYRYRVGPVKMRAKWLEDYYKRKFKPEYIAVRRRAEQKYRQKHKAERREYNRLKSAAWRAKKKAALQPSKNTDTLPI